MNTRVNVPFHHWNGFVFHLRKQLLKKTHNVDYQPLTSIRPGAPIEFYIPASTEEYLDLKNSRLHVTCRIIKKNGSPCPQDAIVAPINDFFQ